MSIQIAIDDDEPPKFEPRKPYARTIRQWVTFLYYKLGICRKRCNSSYSCDVCGEFPHDDYPSSTMLNMSSPKYNSYYSYEFGVIGYDWDEEHQCENCGAVYGFGNSSC